MTEHIYTDTDTLRHIEEMYRRGEILGDNNGNN